MDPNRQELDERDQEIERLQQEKMILLGLMAGGYAYFLRQFMIGHHSEGLTPDVCEQTILDALKRVLATQERFGYEYVSEIEAALARMSQAQPLTPYIQQVCPQDD